MGHAKSVEIENIGSMAGEYSLKAGVGFLRFILLFGMAAVMLGLILVPLLMQRTDRQLSDSLYPNLTDQTITGSIKPNSGSSE
ncbi:hypothetical protein N5853_03070 [Bartonella sp. HY329]|uniref:hypothetical protein n=1 Tax=unclassified Bartonella TaxID=2645622 RepID=UPI0021C7DEBC|nr:MULTISPECIES: hypothetical protein [unclassified Bartonella]UXM95625.1 hypothetical protein N5853_03070 [Bartonella sp. HY329]UXN09950.1 hypothetical protein N5852_03080 [Bartonella sp. HY328]